MVSYIGCGMINRQRVTAGVSRTAASDGCALDEGECQMMCKSEKLKVTDW